MYLYRPFVNSACYFGITPAKADVTVLGDNFLQYYTVIFNKHENSIGFVTGK